MATNTTTIFDSLNDIPAFIAKPSQRFGATYISNKFRNKTVPGELMVDKISGEHFIRREEDDRVISFGRQYRYAYEILTELNIVLANSSDFKVPSTGFYYNFDFDMFLLNNNNQYDIFSADGAFTAPKDSDDNPVMVFRESKYSNGFILRIVPRDTDRSIIEYLTACYNNRYFDYTGDDPVMQEHAKRFAVTNFYDSNAIITYKVRGVPVSGLEYMDYQYDAVVDYCRINDTTAIKFPDNILYNIDRERLAYVEIEIVSINFLKISHMRNLIRQYPDVYQAGFSLYQTPDSKALIHYVNIIGFSDTPEQIYELPISKNLINLMDIDYMNKALSEYGRIKTGAAVIVSEDKPADTTWVSNTEWKAIVGIYREGAIFERLENSDLFDELEDFINPKNNKITSYFTVNRSDLDGIWLDGWDPTDGDVVIDGLNANFGDGSYLVDYTIAALTASDGSALYIKKIITDDTGE